MEDNFLGLFRDSGLIWRNISRAPTGAAIRGAADRDGLGQAGSGDAGTQAPRAETG